MYGITSRAAFGNRSRDQEAFASVRGEITKLMSGFNIADMFPSVGLLQWLTGYKSQVEKLHQEADRIVKNIINEHKKRKATLKICKIGDDEDLIGHYKDACPDSAEVVPPEKVLPVPPMVAETQAAVETELAGQSETKFGSWMVVARKPRARKLNAKAIPKNMVTGHQRPIFQDSRFGILDSVNEEESIPDFTAKVENPHAIGLFTLVSGESYF
ncbi:hypothetical protein WN944_024279 [Citrus x changshan-huyou]|uniref:Uncharacterized protein n=1 Tax=Citrus x changshan-huyou TaxID=2935761 RepID=A0AAP0LNA0_9ROSI